MREASALGVVEHEELRLDVAINKVMRLAAKSPVELPNLDFCGAFVDLDAEKPVAYQESRGQSCPNRFPSLALSIRKRFNQPHLHFAYFLVVPTIDYVFYSY